MGRSWGLSEQADRATGTSGAGAKGGEGSEKGKERNERGEGQRRQQQLVDFDTPHTHTNTNTNTSHLLALALEGGSCSLFARARARARAARARAGAEAKARVRARGGGGYVTRVCVHVWTRRASTGVDRFWRRGAERNALACGGRAGGREKRTDERLGDRENARMRRRRRERRRVRRRERRGRERGEGLCCVVCACEVRGHLCICFLACLLSRLLPLSLLLLPPCSFARLVCLCACSSLVRLCVWFIRLCAAQGSVVSARGAAWPLTLTSAVMVMASLAMKGVTSAAKSGKPHHSPCLHLAP